jgi:trans-2,3-dihydro-3-hydroxyanthranilate isomerase
MDFHYRLVNVFAESTFGGNPLCVFEDARGLSDAQMQAIALQFNLSETVFILPSERATARMRIFTTGYEMPFAGHPTLGTAHVVRQLLKTGNAISLECKAGIVPVRAASNEPEAPDVWTFTAPVQGLPVTAKCALPGAEVAAMLGLQVSDLRDEPLWVNTGTDQLLVPLRTIEAVQRAQPDSSRLADWPPSSLGRKTAYVFAWDDHAPSTNERLAITSRYFFTKQGGGVAEDPGTGSACANLGGWWISQKKSLPASIQISQGEQVQRPSRLYLDVSPECDIQVGGRVIELGRGVINLG